MGTADSKYIDVAGGIARVGGNEALYVKLLGKFEASVDIAGFDAAIASGDYDGAGSVVHTAKGVAGNLSMPAFFDHCAALLGQLRGGGTPNDGDVALFGQLYAETLAAVKAYLEV